MDETNEIGATIRGERIVLEIHSRSTRIGLTPEGWEQLRQLCDSLVAAIRLRRESGVPAREAGGH